MAAGGISTSTTLSTRPGSSSSSFARMDSATSPIARKIASSAPGFGAQS